MPPQQSITYFYTEALLQAKKLTQHNNSELRQDRLMSYEHSCIPLICKRRNEPLQSTLPETQEIDILQVNEIDPLTSASD